MIETLDKLTVAQFVDLICGDTRVIVDDNEVVHPNRLTYVIRNIVIEFREIADVSGVRVYLADIEDLVKARSSVIMFTMCENLIALHANSNAREVLEEYGIDTSRMTDERVAAEIASRLARAKSVVEKIEAETADKDDGATNIRREFDEQTAALMAYFKFQIDETTMKATTYAHLIARHNKEIKTQLSALKKK